MDLITEGQRITLFFPKDASMVEMTCNVEKVYDDRIDLILPQYFMRYIKFLNVGDNLTAKAFSKLGTIDFNTVIIHSPMEECFTIELDYNSLKLTPGPDIPVVNAIERLEVFREDGILNFKTFIISTEYIKFYSDKKFAIEENIECALILPRDYGIINFKGTISEVDPIYTNEYTAVISTMTEAGRQALLYYMYVYSTETD